MLKDKRVLIDEITVGLVEHLKRYAKVKKTNEVITNGVSLLKWAVDQAVKGNKIASYNPSKNELELFSMPILDRIEVAVEEEKKTLTVKEAVSNH